MTWMSPPNGEFGAGGIPKQGCLDDCIFISGLSSYVWTDGTVPVKIENNGFYWFYLYNSKIKKTAKVSKKLCYENGMLPFASSDNVATLWPAYYEKAYAAFLKNGRNHVSIDTFVMRAIGFGRNGKQVMEDLTNFTYTDPMISAIADCYAFINGNCLAGKTKKPMIAWTLSGNNPDGIAGNHSYSVLGVTDDQYIILRDPRRGAAEPTVNVLKGKKIYPGGVEIDLDDVTDGTFALKKDTFKARFYKLAFSP
jgi:Calpain family cysteine protease